MPQLGSRPTSPGVPPTARVLHVLKLYRPDFTGEGVFLERCAAVMQALAPGVEHELLVTHTPRPADPADGAGCSALARVHWLTDRPDLGEGARHARLLAWTAANIGRYDTVHVRTHADWYFLSYALAKLAGRRLVLSATLDDSLPVLARRYRPALRPLAARAFPALFDAFVSISPKLQAETLGTLGDAPGEGGRCHLIPCGVTVPPRAPGRRERVRAELGAGPDDPVALFVGGLCERKDPAALVEAMPALLAARPGARLALVGPEIEPDYAAAMRARAAALGVAHAVAFLGERLDPHPFFEAADLLAFPSRLEGFGTVVPEAMAHGLPVLARRLDGVNDDFVVEGETGFAFRDQAGLEAGLLRLAADPALRAALGAKGKRLAETRFAMPAVARRYLEVYGFPAPAEPPLPQLPLPAIGCTASALDRRFQAPEPAADGGQGPRLLVMVDAEEAFDWSAPFRRAPAPVDSMRAQHLAHRVFERHGVVPTYLADFPVATNEEGAAPLRELLAGGRAELGAQLHPWVNPPFDEEVCERNSYIGFLPPALEFAKAERLTRALEDSFGARPRIFRAGRFGAGPRTADIVKALGYLADSSLTPCWPAGPIAALGGRAAWSADAAPRWLDRERALLHIPVTAGWVGRLARRGPSLAPLLFHRASEALNLPGAAARLGLLERVRLSPEGTTIEEAKRLTRALRARGQRVFVLTYHSPSLEPGNTPYVRTADDRARFLGWLDEYLAFFREEIGGRPASWRELHPATAGAAGAAAPSPAMAG